MSGKKKPHVEREVVDYLYEEVRIDSMKEQIASMKKDNKEILNEKDQSMGKLDHYVDLIEKTTATPADSKDFLSDLSEIVHSETSYNKDSSYKVVKSISDTIDVVADNFDNLSKVKKEGKSRAEWFRDQIDR